MDAWRKLLSSFFRLLVLSFRIAAHRKLVFMGGGILVYYAGLYALATFRPGEGFGANDALGVLVQLPGTAIAIYLAMDLVSGERDRSTLEMLYSASSSHVFVWTVRMVSLYALLAASLVVMSTVSYFLFAELPILTGAMHAFVPTFLVANLTFFLSVMLRSGNAAGMLSLSFLVVVLLTAEALKGTPYFIFMTPFDQPVGIDDFIWKDQLLFNRLGLLAGAFLFLMAGLARMSRREKLLS